MDKGRGREGKEGGREGREAEREMREAGREGESEGGREGEYIKIYSHQSLTQVLYPCAD